MTTGRKQQEQKRTGALVLVSRPSVASRSSGRMSSDFPNCETYDANAKLLTPRSTFLVQLAGQYENKTEAAKRRAETRDNANKRYGQTLPKANMRHLVWA